VVREPTVDGLNWAALAHCESGNDPRAVSSGGSYRGLYQFSMSTWRAVGGVGDPIDASRSEQTYRAQVLYRRAGAGQWPHCGSRLFS
jgi:membrane-bound lytic murein transglycosylase MltF